ncbi:morphogenetic protein [Salmonella enterica subsp. enterica]|nr:morphogenetic protein [Salmonella enterica subsp. enterica serovar Typhimurium]EDV1179137.1 morphogenetic protein [Salmonella enterica subsp. enterica]EIR0229986.1 morphogenetic protein [Salmonella enterica subsp. enterica serovar 4,[5],12:i:-]EBX0907563.1 morphogenetic protein [Salmonella enterica subsp. enterica serovar Typhimurium]EBX3805699.1 morphogenetic protein [Salmonella enterica subsp. enterica serovar Typhimurium]
MKGEVKERGMIFNDEMVRAILEGRKTQTRRIMKNQPAEVGPEAPVMVRKIGAGFQWYGADGVSSVFNCPFGIVGDRIWVRETWAILGNEDGCSVDWNDNLCRGDEKNAARIYRASCEQKPGDYGLWSIGNALFWMPLPEPPQEAK